jgi:hypothetical protein
VNLYNPLIIYRDTLQDNQVSGTYFPFKNPDPINRVVSFIIDGKVDDFIYSLTKKYRLADSETVGVCKTIAEVFLGDYPLGEFKSRLSKVLSNNPSNLEAILVEITTTLVVPIIGDLRMIQEERRGATHTVQPATPPISTTPDSRPPVIPTKPSTPTQTPTLTPLNQNNIINLRDKQQ